MAKFEKTYQGNVQQVLAKVDAAAKQAGSSVNLVEECRCQTGDVGAVMRVYEKYFMRNNSAACLSVMVVGSSDDTVRVSAVGSGGGSGVLNLSWGANSSFLKDFESFM